MHPPQQTLSRKAFPADFVWGVATSSYQIEGASSEDGKGPSIWDEFCRQAGAIVDGSSGDVACDHYHRYPLDLDLLAALGIPAYRFSVSWPRVQPLGEGPWNPKGLDFYDRLVDGLLQRSVAPYMTLNHWDLPAALQQKGGWASRDTVNRFVEYAQAMQRRLGDRVRAITTHNEPWVIAVLGHEKGIFAPGIRERATALQVAHHLLLSHGLSMRAMRSERSHVPMGIVLNLSPVYPASDSDQDVRHARLEDGRLVRWFMDPLFGKDYPKDIVDYLGKDAPSTSRMDMDAIAEPMDFLGVNYYSRVMARASGPFDPRESGLPLTAMDWEVFPQGLTDLLCRLDRDYRLPPLYIMENGAAFEDRADADSVHDPARTAYIQEHIRAMRKAMDAGVNVGGYMVWSLLDNFEWASGCSKRFGIVHVDYQSQRRTPKDSALWYRDFLRGTTGTTIALDTPRGPEAVTQS